MSQYGLAEFLREMTRMVDIVESDCDRVIEAERMVGKLVQQSDWLAPEKRIPASDGYARYPLYCDPENRFEVIALVWQPGQKTLLHDHDGTWGAEGVIVGRMSVTNFEQVQELPGNRVELRPLGDMFVNAQETGQLLPPADCHIVANDGDGPAITVHVYGKQLLGFRVFEASTDLDVYHVRDQHLQVSYNDLGWYV
jgi:predicted metal-dependent enzyme (double-stranded beta helix superfamily)